MPTRRGKEPDKPRREFRATCGKCDDGWIHETWVVTTWRLDGKQLKRRVERQWPLPANWEAQDRFVNYYSAVRRCPCMRIEILAREELPESLVDMPAEIGQTTIGSLVKRMPG